MAGEFDVHKYETGSAVWHQDLRSSQPDSGLEMKLGSLFVLLVLTILFGLIPVCFFRLPRRTLFSADARQKILSLVSCFAGGVFLATCLLDLVPDYLSGMKDALSNLRITLQFPLPEFIMAMGFFIVLMMEQIVLAYKDQSGSLEEERALMGASSEGSIQSQYWDKNQRHDGRHHVELDVHLHVDFNSHSIIRSFILVLSLSLHSVFEGLAVGLQEVNSRVLEISVALLIHKCIISFSLTLKLVQSHLRPGLVLCCIFIFALMSPLGIAVGIALTEAPGAIHQLTRSVLEGLASGTFIYITFLEILPHELNFPEQRILKVMLLIIGFSAVTGVLFIRF